MKLAVSQRVQHDEYGLGVISEVDAEYTVIEFDQHGRKKFLTQLVSVQPVPAQNEMSQKGSHNVLIFALLGSIFFLVRTGELFISLVVFVVLIFLTGFWRELYRMIGRDYKDDPTWKKVLKTTGVFLVVLLIIDQGCKRLM